MKNKLVVVSICAAFLIIIASFPSVVASNNIEDIKETIKLDKVDLLDLIQGENNSTGWFPGFMLVQLVKGVLAFFLVLMILLDLAEPANLTG